MHQIRIMDPTDLDAVFEINQAARPAVGDLTRARLEQLFAWCKHRLVASNQGSISGFLLAMEPGQPYPSANYRFFEDRGQDHVYVDRIAVALSHRNGGMGLRLYQELFTRVRGRAVTCEVNTVPPNPGSLRFHTRIGFETIGEQTTEGGKKRVALLCRHGKA